MNIRILDHPPISGTITEVLFDAVGIGLWVHFDPDDDDAWVGVFGLGGPVATPVAVLTTPPVACIGAGDTYMVNYHTRQLLGQITGLYTIGALPLPAYGWFLLWDVCEFRAVTPAGTTVWISERVSWDGLRNIHLVDGYIHGEAWSPSWDGSWTAFTLDLQTGAVSDGSYPQER
jgi:hypothetical protein